MQATQSFAVPIGPFSLGMARVCLRGNGGLRILCALSSSHSHPCSICRDLHRAQNSRSVAIRFTDRAVMIIVQSCSFSIKSYGLRRFRYDCVLLLPLVVHCYCGPHAARNLSDGEAGILDTRRNVSLRCVLVNIFMGLSLTSVLLS